MTLKTKVKDTLNGFFAHYGYQLIHSSKLLDWQKCAQTGPTYNKSKLPEGAEDYLQLNSPKFLELQKRYSDFDKTVTEPLVWRKDYLRSEDMLHFRGDNAYVYQLRGPNMDVCNYALSTYYLLAMDKLELFSKLTEDEYFGNYTFTIADKVVSRDLLDSITEIYFLERHLEISSTQKNFKVLDVGAGYGRLAHRLLNAVPNIQQYFCADAVAASTFISDYYLRFRKLEDRATVIPLDEIEDTLENQSVDIAINIHSFSECRIAAIQWWLQLLTKHGVKHLMIVPNRGVHGGNRLLTNDQNDFAQVIEKYGYRLMAKDPKYSDPVVHEYGVNPTYHYLFELH